MQTTRSKPQTKSVSKVSAGTVYNPEVQRRKVEIPGPGAGFSSANRLSDLHNKTLIVGREIHIKGEIKACDRLVVEGTVEAALADARTIEITSSGHFKGSASVEEADISGHFDGNLTVKGKLTVRAGGRVDGSIRYASVVIEQGGEISGDMETIGHGPVSELPVPGGPTETVTSSYTD